MTCRVTGCGQRTTRYGVLCNKHNLTDRRHGHPEQEGITGAALKPYRGMVRGLIERNSSNDAWAILDEQWRTAAAQSQAYMDRYLAGQPCAAIERRAHSEIAKVGREVEARAVIETTIALFVMQEIEARRFRSDRAFRFQLVRRLRRLTDVNVGEYWDQTAGRTKRVYRDLPPRVSEVFARIVIETIGGPCMYLAQRATAERREEAEARQRARQRLNEALSEVR